MLAGKVSNRKSTNCNNGRFLGTRTQNAGLGMFRQRKQ